MLLLSLTNFRVAESPPLVKILSNITYKYALEAQFGFASIYPTGLCDNYNSQTGRFNDSLLGSHSILRPELYGLLCGTTCTMTKAAYDNATASSASSNSPTPMPSPDINHNGASDPLQNPFSQPGSANIPLNPVGNPTLLDDPVIAA